MREVDHTIPDEVLDFMRDCALAEIKRMEEEHLQKRRDRLDKIRQSGAALKHESTINFMDYDWKDGVGTPKETNRPKCGNHDYVPFGFNRVNCEYEAGICIHCKQGLPL